MIQASFTFARAAGEAAATACLAKAERLDFDSKGCAAYILTLLRLRGPQSGEDLTEAAAAAGYRPHDGRATGGVFLGLQKANLIRCLRSDLPRRFGHGTSGGRLWEAVR